MDALLPLLPTLITLARTGSIRQSAGALGVPRSTVSRRLKRIEALVGFKVAEHTNHRITLTAAGRRLVDGAVDALARLETVREQALERAGEVSGVLAVAMPAGAAGTFGSSFLAFLNARHPLVDIELTVTDRRNLQLEDGFDLVLVLGAPESSSWLQRRLGETEWLAVASPSYLARKGTPATVEALAGHLLLTFASAGVKPRWPQLQGEEFAVRPCLATNDLSVLRDTAVAAMGIALLPFHVVVDELASGTLIHVLPHLVGQSIEVHALYPPERRASPLLRAALAAIVEFSAEQHARVDARTSLLRQSHLMTVGGRGLKRRTRAAAPLREGR